MDYHLDRKVILNPDSEHKGLYDWSLQEIDAKGKKIGRDLIPWDLSFSFTASEVSLRDTVSIDTRVPRGSEEKHIRVQDSQFIFAKLTPQRRGGQFRDTCFSMLGTGRNISRIELHIEKTVNDSDREQCSAWGCVSYTFELDYRNETSEDCLVFRMSISPERFSTYAERITSSAVDEVFLRVRGVQGFYSDWSPGISTDSVKVLTDAREHVVAIPKNCTITPPRIGEVAEAEVYFRTVCKLVEMEPDIGDDGDDPEDEEDAPTAPGNEIPPCLSSGVGCRRCEGH